MTAPVPDNEADRIAALRKCAILDTAPSEHLDNLVRLVARVCEVPIAAVSLIDENRQWFKAITGLDITETPRDVAFCAHTILQPDLMIVPDAQADPRFAENALVTDAPHIRFYAGMPLITSEGHALGSLCVIDQTPRQLTADQEETLRLLGRLVLNQLEASYRAAEREQLQADHFAAEEERRRLAAIVESSSDAIYTVSLDGMVTSWNRGAERLYGYAAAEIVGRRFALVPPDRRQEIEHVLAAMARGESSPALETVRVTKTGTVEVSLRISPMLGADGRVTGVSMIAQDITERKRAEAALQAEREFTHALLESLQEGIVACDAGGTLSLFNQAAREFHGQSEQPLPPEQWAEHFDLYYADGVTRMNTRDIPLFRAFQGEVLRDAEFVIAPGFGPARTLLASGRSLYSPDGEKLGAVVAMHDVTERRQAEREVARLAAIVESSEEAILAATLDGTLVSWNTGAGRLYGYAASEMIGRHVSCLARAGESNPFPAMVTRLVRGEAIEPVEVTRTRRDGAQFHASLSFSPIRDAAGEIVGVSCIARDITARKKAEDALQASRQRLTLATESAQIGIWDWNAVTNKLLWDEQMHAIHGICEKEFDGAYEDWRKRVHPDDVERVEAELTQAVGAGEEFHAHFRIVRSDGEVRHIEAHAVQQRADNGSALHMIGVNWDVTTRKQAEEALQESNAALQESEIRLRRLGDAAFEGIAVSQNGVLVDVNAAFAAKFGYESPDEMTGLPASALPAPESLELVMRKVATWDEEPYEAVLLRRDGTMFIAEIRGRRTQFNGKPARVTAVRNITRQKTLERELREREERLRAILKSAPVILYAVDADGIVTLSEGTGLAALGLKPGEAVGRSVYEFSDGDAVGDENARLALAGNALSYDIYVSEMWLHTELSPVLGPDGTPAGYIGVCFDITERVASEERFRVLFEQSSHAHLLFSEDGGIIDCNTAALTMMRCEDKIELLGIHPALLSPEFQPDGRRSSEKGAEMCRLAWQNGSHHFEWQRRALDGHEYPVEVTLTPVTLGTKPTLLSVWHDLTERKRHEEQLQDHAIALEFQKLELERINGELESLATTDGLTGLKNHRAFQERLSEEVGRASRYAIPLSVVLLDVDKFKSYNDTYGHPAGDAVLRAVAQILQSCARDTDIVARYGGEEFVLILPQTDVAGAMTFAERVRVAIESHPWPVRTVTASFGVASLRLGEETGTQLVVRADAALYKSKDAGRNRVSREQDDTAVAEASPIAAMHADLEMALTPSDAVFISDLSGVFLDVNERACELLGFAAQELIGTEGIRLIHPDDLAVQGWRLDEVIAGQTVVTERRVRCADGTWLNAELQTERLPDGTMRCVLRETACCGYAVLEGNRLLREAGDGFSMLDALVAAVDNKDRYTRRHSEDVLTHALSIAREMGLDSATQDTIAIAALLHDVGKIGVPDAVLRKPGALTAKEFETIKRHPQIGAAIVSVVPGLEGTLASVRHHHERWDGGGYPFGLRGTEIPFLARLMAVADAFSAMTMDRPYRSGMETQKALSILEAGSGSQWDPACIEAFLTAMRTRGSLDARLPGTGAEAARSVP